MLKGTKSHALSAKGSGFPYRLREPTHKVQKRQDFAYGSKIQRTKCTKSQANESLVFIFKKVELMYI